MNPLIAERIRQESREFAEKKRFFTGVHLTEEQKHLIEQIKRETGIPQSAVIRMALDIFFQQYNQNPSEYEQ